MIQVPLPSLWKEALLVWAPLVGVGTAGGDTATHGTRPDIMDTLMGSRGSWGLGNTARRTG